MLAPILFLGAMNQLNAPNKAQETEWWCWAAAGQTIMSYDGATQLQQCQEANHEFQRNDCCGTKACANDLDCIPAGTPANCHADADCVPQGAGSCTVDSDCSNNDSCIDGMCSPYHCEPTNQCSANLCRNSLCLPAACVHGGSTEWNPWGFTAQNTACGTTVGWNGVMVEIDANLPIEFAWSFACSDPTSPSCYQLCNNTWVSGGHVLSVIGYKDDASGKYVLVNDPWPPNQGTRYWLGFDDWQEDYQSNKNSNCPALYSTSCGAHYTQSNAYGIVDQPVCSADNFGFPADNFQACYNYQSLRARYPVTISFDNDGTVASSFQYVQNRPVMDRMTYTQWNAALAQEKVYGYRPESVSVLVADQPLVTAIWTPIDGPFYSQCALDEVSLPVTDDIYFAQGYLMVDLFAYVDVVPFFCATWVKKSGGYEYYYGLTSDQYNTLFQKKSATLVPVRLSAYDTAQGRRYAALWFTAGESWAQYYDMTGSYYQTQYNAQSAQGFVESNITSLDGLYTVLWTKPLPPPPPPPPSQPLNPGLILDLTNHGNSSGLVSAIGSALGLGGTTVAADGTTQTTAIVTLTDSTGAPVGGKIVSLVSNRGGIDAIVPPTGMTNASGQATFTVTSTIPGVPVLTALDTSDTITLMQTGSVTFTPFAMIQFQNPINADFGTTSTPLSRVYTIENVGSAPTTTIATNPLTIDLNGGAWLYGLNTCSGAVLQPGDNCTLEVSFEAGRIVAGVHNVTLHVQATSGGDAVLTLTGTAQYSWHDCPSCGYQGATACSGLTVPSGSCATPNQQYAYVVSSAPSGTQNEYLGQPPPANLSPCGTTESYYSTSGSSVRACGTAGPTYLYVPDVHYCLSGAPTPYWAGVSATNGLSYDSCDANTCITHVYVCQ